MEKLYEKKIEIVLTDKNISYDDDQFKIGNLSISTHHDQDCCESVRGEFSVFKHYVDEILKMKKIDNIRIKGVEGEGFVIFLESGYDSYSSYYENKVGVFVPCYNEQNGYYSDKLELIISELIDVNTLSVIKIDLREKELISDKVY